MTMQTIEIHVPDNILQYLEILPFDKELFVLAAIQEKIEREGRKNLDAELEEGYRAAALEDSEIRKDFEYAEH